MEIDTPHGVARVHLDGDTEAHGARALVLGHGAGGGVRSADLQATTEAAVALGFLVARVEQPYRVAGRRSPPPARQLDTAWLAVLRTLREGPLAGHRLVVGGRSSGARVACRTAAVAEAAAVLCLAFPLLPPGPAREGDASRSRLPELEAVPASVQVLVVQGNRDPFGLPPATATRTVVTVDGTHTHGAAATTEAVSPWLSVLTAFLTV